MGLNPGLDKSTRAMTFGMAIAHILPGDGPGKFHDLNGLRWWQQGRHGVPVTLLDPVA